MTIYKHKVGHKMPKFPNTYKYINRTHLITYIKCVVDRKNCSTRLFTCFSIAVKLDNKKLILNNHLPI